MTWFGATGYWLARAVVERGVAALYLLAFACVLLQFRPLLGERGLLPVARFVRAVPFRRSPSLFYWHYSDNLVMVVGWVGVVDSVLVVAGLPQAGPPWAPLLAFAVLWLLYLSIVNVGQIFYAFGWESLLLEAGAIAAFLGSDAVAPPVTVMWLLRWLVFRLEFGAGLIKLRGDPCWRDLTCLYFHHETQPMAGPLSWYFHRLPKPLHKVEVAANHVAQLIVPFGLFCPQPVASIAAAVVIVTQFWLVASGNFSWLNWTAIVLAFAAVDDRSIGALVGGYHHASAGSAPDWYVGLVLAFTTVVVALSYWPARNLLSRHQRMNAPFNPVHLVNAYGAFGSITRHRDEIVLEGTDSAGTDSAAPDSTAPDSTAPDSTAPDSTGPDDSAIWHEYEFKGKPGDPARRPPQVAPYHLRLDWLMWFAAMSSPSRHPWFRALVARLLEGDVATLRLLRRNPFPESPPKFVRARLYRYRFTTYRERRETGAWWQRSLLGEYLPPVSSDDVGLAGRPPSEFRSRRPTPQAPRER